MLSRSSSVHRYNFFPFGILFHLISQDYFEEIEAEKGDNGDGHTSEACKIILSIAVNKSIYFFFINFSPC